MKDKIKKVPLPLCGTALGMAALGNLLQSYSPQIRLLCGLISAMLLLLVVLKLIFFPNMIREDLGNPIMASVSGTFSMALMLLSVYAKPYLGAAAFYIWIAAILLHILLIVYFTVKFIFKLQMPKVFASYYIVYVGIAVASITAPAYEKQGIGTAAFWFGLVSLVVLLVLVTIRYVRYPDVPDPAKPLMCIYAAPASLCLAGYLQSVNPKSTGMVLALFVVSTVLYLFSLVKAVGYLRLPFFPSYAAFTFPFVISAIAAKQTGAYLMSAEMSLPFLPYLVTFETVVAVILVCYTLVRFMMYIFGDSKKS